MANSHARGWKRGQCSRWRCSFRSQQFYLFFFFPYSFLFCIFFCAYICVFLLILRAHFLFFVLQRRGGGGLEFGGELTKRKINIGKPIDGGRMPSSAPEVDVAATAAVAVAVATLGAAAVASAACGHFSSRVSVRCAFRQWGTKCKCGQLLRSSKILVVDFRLSVPWIFKVEKGYCVLSLARGFQSSNEFTKEISLAKRILIAILMLFSECHYKDIPNYYTFCFKY